MDAEAKPFYPPFNLHAAVSHVHAAVVAMDGLPPRPPSTPSSGAQPSTNSPSSITGACGASPLELPRSAAVDENIDALRHELTRTTSIAPSIPSLAVDYDEDDASDPEIEFTWLQRVAVFGFSDHPRDDPRYKALAKLKLIAQRHGIGDLKLVDYYRAYLVYSAAANDSTAQSPNWRSDSPTKQHPANSAPELPSVRTSRSRPGPLSARARLRSILSPRRYWANAPIDSRADVSCGGSSPFVSAQWSPWRERSPWVVYSPLVSPKASADSINPSSTSSSPAQRPHTMDSSSPEVGVRNFDSRNRSEGEADELDGGFMRSNSAWNDTQVTADQVRLMYHMLRHAESIYGLPLTMASAPLVSLRRISGRGIAATRNGLRDDDIVHHSFTASTFRPAHYVAVDRPIQAVVVCVRGTANLLDSLTDVAATYDRLKVRRMRSNGQLEVDDIVEGYGHAGVVRSARNLFSAIREPTLAALRANPGFDLLLTGHSLGAAIAGVLSLIMRDDDAFPHALAICVAPPPCLSLALAEETTTTAITVVNGADIVPRLSIPVLLPYLATARYVADLPMGRRALVGAGLPSMAVQWSELQHECEARVEKLREQHHGKQLYIPGAVFHIVRTRDRVDSAWPAPKTTDILPVERTIFARPIARERGMFLGHAPSRYRAKLNAVLRSMGAPKLAKPRPFGTRARLLRTLTRLPTSRSTDSTTTNSTESVDGVVKDLFHRGLSLRQSSLHEQEDDDHRPAPPPRSNSS